MPALFRLAIAASGVVALLWALPAVMAEAGCKTCAEPPDLPRVATGALASRRIR